MIAFGDTLLIEETAPEIISDLGRAKASRLKELLNKLVEKAQVQAAIAALNQHRINQANKRIEMRVVEGIGQKVAEIDVGVFFEMRNLHGHNCWNDPEFVEAFLRDNPGCRLALHTRKYFSGWKADRAEEMTNDECRMSKECPNDEAGGLAR